MRRAVALAVLVAAALAAAEITVFVLVAHQIGALSAVLVLVATSLAGAWLLRREGVRGWRRFRTAAASGQPSGPVAAGGLVGLIGAVLLLVPGFVTDAVGLVLLTPPGRRAAGVGVQRVAERRLSPAAAGSLFGPRRVRVRTGAPRRPGSPPDTGAGTGTGADGRPAAIEGEIVDSRPAASR
ncbi:MAG TPA: FxsA family protein [Micromonosporaceae bacterium]